MRFLFRIALVMAPLLGLAACGVTYAPLPAGAVAGRLNLYDYSPTVIQTGSLQQLWWCGSGFNPKDQTQYSDTIQYQWIDLANNTHSDPYPVLGETQGGWDSNYVCNPKVIMGSFNDPLGDGQTYKYAMYYVGIAATLNNYIGVAFSHDGQNWKKYPHPIISPETSDSYGVGQPALYNDDHRSAIRMFYEDTSNGEHHEETISTDGVHFKDVGMLTTKGLDPDPGTWGDMAYNAQDGYWYALFNLPDRDPATTGGVQERGPYGVKMYRIPDGSLLTGATPWELLTEVSTSSTGYESNFLPGFARDMFGNLLPGPAISFFLSISDPSPPWDASELVAGQSGSIGYWKISPYNWTPGQPDPLITRYSNQMTHMVTTGWVDPKGGFTVEQTLGHLYEAHRQGATVPFYGCKSGTTDYFISLDEGCEGGRILGINGYAFPKPVTGMNLHPLYRCKSSTDHFVSTDPKCEGQATQQLLGYVLP